MDTTSTAPFFVKPDLTPERKAFYERLETRNMAPLWEVFAALFPPQPAPQTVPVLWRYDEVRPLLIEGGGLLTPQEAERRVLVLENPGLKGQSRVTNSLYAGLQLILPGETAPCHRHASAALRFVLEGTTAYTAVNGERTTMHPGDFILTPSWTFHDHGNSAGGEATIWMDGLDMPMVNLFDTSFAEHYPRDVQRQSVPEGDSFVRYGANMLPVDYTPARSSPIFNYPYERSRETLDELTRNGPVHACHGVKMRFVNPATGGYPMPTIAAFLQLLPGGFGGAPYRQTDATVYCVVEGRGRTRVGGVTFDWTPRDIFVVPSWTPAAHEAAEDAVLFSMSDRPAQQALGLWREQAPATGN